MFIDKFLLLSGTVSQEKEEAEEEERC